jgi:hypothetical protein
MRRAHYHWTNLIRATTQLANLSLGCEPASCSPPTSSAPEAASSARTYLREIWRRKPFLVFGVERDGARKFCSMMTKMAVTPAATLADLWSITPRQVHCEPCHLRSSTVLRAAVSTSPGAEVDRDKVGLPFGSQCDRINVKLADPIASAGAAWSGRNRR